MFAFQRDIPKAMSRKRNKDDSAEDEATDAKRQCEEVRNI